MKRILILILLALPITLAAQLTFELKGLVNDKISSNLTEGDKLELKELIKNKKGEKAIVIVNGEEQEISFNDLKRVSFKPESSKQFWQSQMIENEVFENIFDMGLQYGLRKDLEEDALDYIKYLNENNMTFEDSYLESYIYSLVYKIYPNKIDDGRPGILNIKIIKDINPNAFIYSNGTMVISTGLLSTINSEEELIGVLSHEVAHFVLDHSIVNINKAEKRKKRAEFWAALATGLAAAADTYAATNSYGYSYDYVPGTLTLSTAVLSYSLASKINERLGLKFSRKQEMQADRCAIELMKHLNVDETALSSALNKIKQYCIVTGNYLALTGKGTHPAIDDRIEEIGEPGYFMDVNYDKNISFVNSTNALFELKNQHFSITADLAKRNIDANVGTEEDYLLIAMTTLYMFDTPAKNNEALDYVNKAKNLNVYPILEIYKQEAIVLIRLDRMNDAKNSLLKYQEGLLKKEESLDEIKSEKQWISLKSYVDKEYEWTSKMINKVSKM